MNPNKNVQRNTVNQAAVKISDVQKSGFKLGYSSQISGTIGKLLPLSLQWVMAGDKVSGGNTLRCQFEPLAVPMTGRLDLDSHNFFVRMRNIYGYDWMEFMNMSQGVSEIPSMPTFTMKGLFQFLSCFPQFHVYNGSAWDDFVTSVTDFLNNDTGAVEQLMDLTTKDFFDEWTGTIRSYMNTLSAPTDADSYKNQVKSVMYLIFDKVVGEGSYLDYFGYPFLSHTIVNKIVDGYDRDVDIVWADYMTDIPLNDVPLRAMYAVWFHYYRNIYTEPKKDCINPQKWTMTALDYAVLSRLLVPRFRNWNIDMFTGAQIDDISRHVYAGIPSSGQKWAYKNDSSAYEPVDAGTTTEMQAEGITSQNLQYIDNDGQVKTINVKVPTMFGNSLIGLTSNALIDGSTTNIPLLQLKRAKMLERFLKRIFYGGDTYRDYIKSIYGSDLSEALSNIPQYLGGSSTPVDVAQEVNNTSTAESPAGTKTAVMSADGSGDGYSCFCDEFGVILNVTSFLPECSYDTMPNQLLYSKLVDFPIPQFSQQDDELSHRYEISRTILDSEKANSFKPFAHHPYKHEWRGRVNDFHGNALSTRKMYNFGRLFDLSSSNTSPKLNASFLHCKPSLEMFISSTPLNDVWFGYADHDFFVERALTAYVEEI